MPQPVSWTNNVTELRWTTILKEQSKSLANLSSNTNCVYFVSICSNFILVIFSHFFVLILLPQPDNTNNNRNRTSYKKSIRKNRWYQLHWQHLRLYSPQTIEKIKITQKNSSHEQNFQSKNTKQIELKSKVNSLDRS